MEIAFLATWEGLDVDLCAERKTELQCHICRCVVTDLKICVSEYPNCIKMCLKLCALAILCSWKRM